MDQILNFTLSPGYVTGLTQTDGSFRVSVQKNGEIKTGLVLLLILLLFLY